MGRPAGSKNKKKSGAAGTEGAAQAWDDAAAKANGDGSKKSQARLALSDEEKIRKEIELPTKLAVDAIALSARQAAAAQKRIDEVNREIAEHQTAIAELNKDKKGDEKERAKHLREVDTGASWGMVECVEVHNFRINTVRTYRADPKAPDGLGEFVSERAMTGEERERRVFDPPPADGPRVEVPAEPAKKREPIDPLDDDDLDEPAPSEQVH